MIERKNIAILYSLIFIELMIMMNARAVVNDVILSSKLFFFNVFPSLFPTMFLGNLLVNNNVFLIIPKFVKNVFKKLFNFDELATSLFIMSFICGSPTNAMFINNTLKNGLTNEDEALNLLCVTHFINPLFIINISLIFFETSKIGYLIIGFLLISNLIKAFFLRKHFKNSKKTLNIVNKPFINTFFDTLKGVLNAVLIILGIIILFSLLVSLIGHIFSFSASFKCIVNGLLEITGGLTKLKYLNINKYLKIFLTYYFISFGGLCIQLQTLSMIENKKIKFLKYFIFRII